MPNPAMTPEQVMPASYLNLGPNRWWEFTEESSHTDCRIECVQPEPRQYKLIMNLPKDHAEHTFETTDVEYGEQLTLIKSVSKAMTCTWVGGLIIPAPCKVGQILQSQSSEGNPATQKPVILTAVIEKSEMTHPPAELHMSPANLQLPTITLTQRLNDSALGTKLLELKMVLMDGVGVISATGNAFGNFYVLKLKGWSGAGQ